MSTTNHLKKDLRKIKENWLSLDPAVRLLDILSILAIILFGFGFLLLSANRIPLIVTNMAFLLYPILIAGYSFSFRGKLADPKADKMQARKEYFGLTILTTLIILTSFLYTLLLNS